jgi:diamine N-acetyltransferase
MLTIKPAFANDFELIRAIAYASWPVAYSEILSEEQLNWMLEKFYSNDRLQQNLDSNHQFFLAFENEIPVGFVGIEHHFEAEKTTRLHKLYLLPKCQGKGFGKNLIDFVSKIALEHQNYCISLNVNKYNKAVDFYKNQGFEIVCDQVIEIGNGFVMDDFRMIKKL